MGIESTQPFLHESFELISTTTILGVVYGIILSLYCLCARSLYLDFQKQDKRRRASFSIGYMSFLLICATSSLALNASATQLAYINHADFPGGPLRYLISPNSTIAPHRTTDVVLGLGIEVLTMAIQIWRLWIIWSGTRYGVVVTVVPLLLLFSFIALDISTNIAPRFLPLNQLIVSSKAVIAMEVATYGVLPGLTGLVTGLIATRLLCFRRQHLNIMGTSEAATPYLSIVAMLVEAYILGAAWSLASAMSYALNSPSYLMFITGDPTIKVVAHFLVVYRVQTGRGWTKQTEEKLTSLRFNHSTPTPTDEVSGNQSRVPASPAATTTIAANTSLPIGHSESVV